SRASFHSLYNSTSFSPPISYFSFQLYGYHRDLHSFPTRRSSDLCPPPRCSRATPTPPTPTSTPRWRATSAAAAPTNGSAPRSSRDRKSTRLNSSHVAISYAVFCLKKKKMAMNATNEKIEHILRTT